MNSYENYKKINPLKDFNKKAMALNGDYRDQFNNGCIYRVQRYTIERYADPILDMFGSTRCGLYFYLRVDLHKTMYITFNKDRDSCFTQPPNFIKSLSHHDKIDQFTVFLECSFNGYCIFYQTRHSPELPYQNYLYNKFAVNVRNFKQYSLIGKKVFDTKELRIT